MKKFFGISVLGATTVSLASCGLITQESNHNGMVMGGELDGAIANITDANGLGIRVIEEGASNETVSMSFSDGTTDSKEVNELDEYAKAKTELVRRNEQGELEKVVFTVDGKKEELTVEPIALRVYGDFSVVAFESTDVNFDESKYGDERLYHALHSANVYIIHNETGKVFSTANYEVDEKGNFIDHENPLFGLGERFIQDVMSEYWENDWAGRETQLDQGVFELEDGIVFSTWKHRESQVVKMSYDYDLNQIIVEDYVNTNLFNNELWGVHFDKTTGNLFNMSWHNGENQLSIYSQEKGLVEYDNDSWVDMIHWFDGRLLFTEDTYNGEQKDQNPFFTITDEAQKITFNDITFNRDLDAEWALFNEDGSLDEDGIEDFTDKEYWGYKNNYFDYWEFTSAMHNNAYTYLNEDLILVKGPTWYHQGGLERNFFVHILDDGSYEVEITSTRYIDNAVEFEGSFFGIDNGEIVKLSDENKDLVFEDTLLSDGIENLYRIDDFEINYDGTIYWTGIDNFGNEMKGSIDKDGNKTSVREISIKDVIRIAPIN